MRTTVQALLFVLVALVLCGTECFVAVRTSTAPLPPFHVVSTRPHHLATGVAITIKIRIEFSGPIDASTLNAESMQVFEGARPIAVDWSYDGEAMTALGAPAEPLSPDRPYELRITTALRSTRKTQLAEPLVVRFTTGRG